MVRNGSTNARSIVESGMAPFIGFKPNFWSLLVGDKMNRFFAEGWDFEIGIISSLRPRSTICSQERFIVAVETDMIAHTILSLFSCLSNVEILQMFQTAHAEKNEHRDLKLFVNSPSSTSQQRPKTL